MSRHHRSDTGHGRHGSRHDGSDDEAEEWLTPTFFTTQEHRDFLIGEINRELRDYEGHCMYPATVMLPDAYRSIP